MIKDFEFLNTEKSIGKNIIYRLSIQDYMTFLEIVEHIKKSSSLDEIKTWKFEIIKLGSNIRHPKTRNLPLFDEIIKFNIPDLQEKKSNTRKLKREDFYRGILTLIDVIVHEYASVSITEIMTSWTIFQLIIAHNLIMRRHGAHYLELTSITGLATYKPKILFTRYSRMGKENKPIETNISITEAFRLAASKNNGGKNVEFH